MEDAVGSDVFGFVHADDRDSARTGLEDLVGAADAAAGTPVELRLLAADGSVVYVEARGNDHSGDPDVGGLVVNVRDVSDRRRADEALRESEARTRSILAGAADGIITLDERGIIESFNNAAQRIFGRGEHEVVGRPGSVLLPDHVHDRFDAFVAEGEPLVDEGRIRYGSSSGARDVVTLEALRSDGEVFPVELTLSAVESGGRRSLTVILRDVTEKRALEQQLAFQALHDGLTGLPNRGRCSAASNTRMTRARRRADLLAVLFLDLDRFKVVNDSLGHRRGDELLCLAARAAATRACATPTRSPASAATSSSCCCEDVANIRAVTELAERIGQALAEPFDLEGTEVFVSASIGIALWRRRHRDPRGPAAQRRHRHVPRQGRRALALRAVRLGHAVVGRGPLRVRDRAPPRRPSGRAPPPLTSPSSTSTPAWRPSSRPWSAGTGRVTAWSPRPSSSPRPRRPG